MKMKLLHLWHGCAEFNRRWPHWVKNESGYEDEAYPRCSICGTGCFWMFGYKSQAPDLIAITTQNRMPNSTEAYWAAHDGWGFFPGLPEELKKQITDHIGGTHGDT
jgi:hypothetical protein